MSQSNRMLRTVQGAPLTDRAVRESTRYFTVLRPPSRSTLNCSWEGKGERARTQGFVAASRPQLHPLVGRLCARGWFLRHRSAWNSASTSESLPCSPPAWTPSSRLAHGAQVAMAATRAGQSVRAECQELGQRGQAEEDRAIRARGELGGKAWPCCFPTSPPLRPQSGDQPAPVSELRCASGPSSARLGHAGGEMSCTQL